MALYFAEGKLKQVTPKFRTAKGSLMSVYSEQTDEALATIEACLREEYLRFCASKRTLNMARGKPSSDQLDLSMPLLDVVSSSSDLLSADGLDCRNYGGLDGLPEAKKLMATMLEEDENNVIVFGNSSLSIMYDTVARCLDFGTLGSEPWSQRKNVKWLCPSPGYDRHFALTEIFGIEMVVVPLLDDGPDMDEIERLVATDEDIKGIWCVPKYSNPTGITFSDKVVRRLASMDCAAKDFRIFWDNAYCVHHLHEDARDQDQVLDIGQASRDAHNPHRYFKFASTSKVTFPGAGIAAFAASPENVAEVKSHIGMQTIGHDKINQLRHVKFLKDGEGIASHMREHAKILRPKFNLVCQKLEQGLSKAGCGSWTEPRGGYFISFDAPSGTAQRIVELAKKAGVVMTGAGATYPYGNDPQDSNIRIAPTLPPLDELEEAMDVFVCCVKLAYVEKLLSRGVGE